MEKNVLFRETQKFRSAILWIPFVAIIGFLFHKSIQQIIFDIPFGNKPMSNTGLIVFILFFGIGFPMLFYYANLITEVRSDGIYYRFIPMHIKWQKITFHEIKNCEIRKYSALRTYGGYGIRYSINGKAYNVSGSMGVMINLNNGKKILFGTQEAENFKNAINMAREGIKNIILKDQ